MKIERETVEHLDRLLCVAPSMGGYFEVPEEMRPVIEELARAWLALDAAPFGMLATYPEANDRATYLYFNGKGLVPIGVECRLVATPASGGPRDG